MTLYQKHFLSEDAVIFLFLFFNLQEKLGKIQLSRRTNFMTVNSIIDMSPLHCLEHTVVITQKSTLHR